MGTSNLGRIDGQKDFQNLFIDFLFWADSTGATTGFPVDIITTRDSAFITIQDDVVIDSSLTVTGNLTVSGNNIGDSLYTTAMEAVTAYISTNNTWWKAKTYGGTWGNLIKWNASDNIEFGAPVQFDFWEFVEDGGVVVAMDMPVSATPADGDEESYTFRIDSNNILKVKASANSSGGVDEIGIEFFGDTGSMRQFVYQDDDFDDNATIDLPSATFGMGFVACGIELDQRIATFTVFNDTPTLISTSGDVQTTDADRKLVIMDGGDDYVTIKNTDGDNQEIRIIYWYN